MNFKNTYVRGAIIASVILALILAWLVAGWVTRVSPGYQESPKKSTEAVTATAESATTGRYKAVPSGEATPTPEITAYTTIKDPEAAKVYSKLTKDSTLDNINLSDPQDIRTPLSDAKGAANDFLPEPYNAATVDKNSCKHYQVSDFTACNLTGTDAKILFSGGKDYPAGLIVPGQPNQDLINALSESFTTVKQLPIEGAEGTAIILGAPSK